MPISRRYSPEHPPGESCSFGLDYSFVIPPGVGISSGSLGIFNNVANPVDKSGDWTIGAISIRGRAIYCMLGGGVSGTDYILRWTAVDTAGNTWVRSTLILCADTS